MRLTADQLNTLCEMLTYCRPYGSDMDRIFRARFLSTLPGIREDAFGNLIVDVGTNPFVVWSSHTDTVHRTSGRQTIHVDTTDTTIRLSRKSRKRSSCLGADDTVGVFIMREMILRGIPGRYIFHYGEEAGCIGSSDLAHCTPEVLDGIGIAIALDRAGYGDIVKTQHGDTCCSDIFAESLASALRLPYTTAHGIFTDTAEYMRIIPECTNLSVGYFNQHRSDEWIDYSHVADLLSALCTMDQSALVVSRDPSVRESRYPRFVDVNARDYSDTDDLARAIADAMDRNRPRRIDGDTSATLWRESYGWQDWCLICDAPIVDESDPDYHDMDHCVCPHEDRDLLDDTRGMSEDDIKFLRYLRGLD